jgi:two-component system, chemotaxis family, protein-glutamate methylesterase/glutaminase
MQNRDIVVIGSSAGGIDALKVIAARLPPTLPAAVFVVQHAAEDSPGLIASILDHAGPLPAAMADRAEPFVHGRIYVAPANRHLLLTAEGLRPAFGPRENRSRPAVDPLFRTAAVHYGPRVIGLVLSGLLADGSAGLRAIVQCGGVGLAQSPADAEFPDMPRNALARAPGARAVPLAEIADTLDELTHQQAPPAPPVPDLLRIEAQLTERAMHDGDWSQLPGSPTRYTCPECSGPLQAIDEGGERRYRCRVGHAFSEPDLLAEKGVALEDSLWVALQTLEERAEMLRAMANADRAKGWSATAANFERRASETARHADMLRATLLSLSA